MQRGLYLHDPRLRLVVDVRLEIVLPEKQRDHIRDHADREANDIPDRVALFGFLHGSPLQPLAMKSRMISPTFV